MRTALLTLIFSAIVFAADYKEINKTVAMNATGSVTITTHKGSVDVSTWDRPEVEMKARIEPEDGFISSGRRLFDATTIQFDSSPGSVQIRTKYLDFTGCCAQFAENNPIVRYTIRMPRMAQLIIRDHRSQTRVSGLLGALDIDTHRGSVRVARLSGPLRLSTHRGDAEVEFAALNGPTSVETHRGSVELSMARNSRFNVDGTGGPHTSFDSDFSLPTRASGKREQSFHGPVNGGGSTIRFHTERGHIRLRAI